MVSGVLSASLPLLAQEDPAARSGEPVRSSRRSRRKCWTAFDTSTFGVVCIFCPAATRASPVASVARTFASAARSSTFAFAAIAAVLHEISARRGKFAVAAGKISARRGTFAVAAGEISVRRGKFAVAVGEISVRRGEFAVAADEISARRGKFAAPAREFNASAKQDQRLLLPSTRLQRLTPQQSKTNACYP
eukprot:316984-Prorocentrum_minimum.AAC.1